MRVQDRGRSPVELPLEGLVLMLAEREVQCVD